MMIELGQKDERFLEKGHLKLYSIIVILTTETSLIRWKGILDLALSFHSKLRATTLGTFDTA